VALWVMGVVLQLAGYVESVAGEAVAQPDSARVAILVLIGPVPGVILLFAAFAAWRWPPMTRAQHAALVSSLRAEE
jgi:Na+/melibiose symporter-like transporter